ncbi:MAG: carboxypeptidase M32 [Rickettsiales bacterium]
MTNTASDSIKTAIQLLEWDRDHLMPKGSAATRDTLLETVARIDKQGVGTFIGAAEPTPYRALESAFRELAELRAAAGILQCLAGIHLPENAPEIPGKVLAALSGIDHELMTRPEIEAALDAAEADKGNLTPKEQRNLELMRREWIYASALDKALVEDLAKAEHECHEVWKEAKKTSDFEAYAPAQQKVLDLCRKKAKKLGDALGVPPYEALMGEYAPFVDPQKVSELFADLGEWLPEVIEEIQAKQPKTPELNSRFGKEKQKALAKQVVKELGYDFNQGLLGDAPHPFCSGDMNETRIFTRYDDADPFSSLYASIHEAGHAMYAQGALYNETGQPVDGALGMDVHESQSMFWEIPLGCNKSFIKYLTPKLQAQFPEVEWTKEQVFGLVNEVQPSLIRVDADRVTYPLHIILRTNIERDLIEGKMEIKDVPERWNQSMKELLGVEVPNHAKGCMQDVHWPHGAFGYFPSYALGALGATQFMDALEKEKPDVHAKIAAGKFDDIKAWLNKNVHERGQQLNPDDLFETVTGAPLGTAAYKNFVIRQYGLDRPLEKTGSRFANRVRGADGKDVAGEMRA